ncbi:MAG: hypothetical protein V4574_13035 [Pseudomonadota bacterium]
MTNWLCGAAALALAATAFASPARQASTGTVRFNGACEPNPGLAGMMRNRDRAEKVTTAKCSLAVVEWGKSVTFLSGGKAVVMFSGHSGDESDITMDAVAVGGKPPAATTNGRCRFYGNKETAELLILCFAAYRDGSKPAGAIATFRVTGRAS